MQGKTPLVGDTLMGSPRVLLDASAVRGQAVRLMASSLAPSPESPALPVPAPEAEDPARCLEPPALAPLALELPAVPGFDLSRVLGITAPRTVPRTSVPGSPPRRPPAAPLVLTHAPVKDDAAREAPKTSVVPAGLFSAAQEHEFQLQVQQLRSSAELSEELPEKPSAPAPVPPVASAPAPAAVAGDMAALQETLVPCPPPAPEPAPAAQEHPQVAPPRLTPATAAAARPETTTTPATAATPTETLEENETIKSLPVEWDKMPLTVEPHEGLDFGLGTGGLARVEEAVHATLTLSNPTGRAYSFRFVSRANARYRAAYSVAAGTLQSAERVACTLTVVPLCTCVVASHEELVVWEGDGAAFARARRVNARLAFAFEVAHSAHLDSEELVVAVARGPLARTQHGAVFRGLFRACPVAVKMRTAHTPAAHAALRRERAVLDALRCPFVVGFVGAAAGPHLDALVTELCPHGALEGLLCAASSSPQQQQQQQVLPAKLRVRILADVARGLAFLHRARLTHRAVCARHVLVASLDVGATCAAKLCGLSRVAAAHVPCAVADVLDPAAPRTALVHTAPELLRPVLLAAAAPTASPAAALPQPQQYFPPADVYSLGMLMCHVLTLQPPYALNAPLATPRELAHAVVAGTRPLLRAAALPPALARLMQQCWAAEPSARPDAPAVLQQLLTLL